MAGPRASTKRARKDKDKDAAEEYSAKRSHTNYNDTITILVGPEKKSFIVHKDVICTKSKFFQAACNDRLLEGRERVVRLPEVSSRVFQCYVDWIYTNEVTKGELPSPSHRPYIELYLLGKDLDDIQFRNKSMERLVAHPDVQGSRLNESCVNLIWEKTPSSSLLRKWMLDMMALFTASERVARMMQTVPTECTQQLVMKLMEVHRGTPGNAPKKLSVGDYLETAS